MTNRANLPRHKIEELKRKEDEIRTKEVYQDFLQEFADEPSVVGKTFVRGEVVNNESKGRGESAKPKLYKPQPTLFKPPSTAPPASVPLAKLSPFEAAKRSAGETARRIMEEAQKARPPKPGSQTKSLQKAKGGTKQISNLEMFKMELQQMQEARDERRKIRKQLTEQLGADKEAVDRIAPSLDDPYSGGNFDSDPNTTNLFLSNINPDSTEQDIYDSFGCFGPLASVKIMWPRTDEEKTRGYLCGFVAFMTRRDAERAVAGLKGKQVLGHEVKTSWAKALNMPAHPVYVPPEMMDLTLPPPPSGLPFNAQPLPEDLESYCAQWPLLVPGHPPPEDGEQKDAWNQMLRNAVVKVVIPTERPLLALIHRTIEFVIKEGPMFEAMLMNRELNNPTFRFLFDNQSPAHVYYRWKLYSILQGENPSNWREDDFRMFEGGSLWKPPPIDFFHSGMPPELYDVVEKCTAVKIPERKEETRERDREDSRSQSPGSDEDDLQTSRNLSAAAKTATLPLTDKQRDKLEDILRQLNPEREKIAAAMMFCLEHAESALEIVECISESLEIKKTPLNKKIARLYLVSDILCNCGVAKIPNVTYFRKFFEENLVNIFRHVHEAYSRIEARLKAEQFKQRVMACFRSWEDAVIYPTEFLIKLQNVFLGLDMAEEEEEPPSVPAALVEDYGAESDVDGKRMEGSEAGSDVGPWTQAELDLDGTPLEDLTSSSKRDEGKSGGFKQMKWEEVDSDLIEAQAMTTSKWEMLEMAEQDEIIAANTGGGSVLAPFEGLVGYESEDDLDGIPMDDDSGNNNLSKSLPSKPSSSGSSATPNGPSGVRVEQSKNEISEEKRKQLREIEVKVMKYQDDIESGKIKLDKGVTISEACAKHRSKLLEKMEEEERANANDGSTSSERGRDRRRDRDRSRSPGRSRSSRGSEREKDRKSSSRKRSRSPKRSKNKSSRSPSPRSSKHKRRK